MGQCVQDDNNNTEDYARDWIDLFDAQQQSVTKTKQSKQLNEQELN